MTGTGGVTGRGGATTTGGAVGSGGQSGTGGVVDAGVQTDAMSTGGAGSGGGIGGGGRGGANTGGAGTAGSAGAGGGGGYPLKNPPVPSAGCGKPATITSSIYPQYRTIMSSGDSRQYVINLPVPYDMNKPYRFIMGVAWLGRRGQRHTEGEILSASRT